MLAFLVAAFSEEGPPQDPAPLRQFLNWAETRPPAGPDWTMAITALQGELDRAAALLDGNLQRLSPQHEVYSEVESAYNLLESMLDDLDPPPTPDRFPVALWRQRLQRLEQLQSEWQTLRACSVCGELSEGYLSECQSCKASFESEGTFRSEEHRPLPGELGKLQMLLRELPGRPELWDRIAIRVDELQRKLNFARARVEAENDQDLKVEFRLAAQAAAALARYPEHGDLRQLQKDWQTLMGALAEISYAFSEAEPA